MKKKVIAMQVAQQDDIESAGIKSKLFHCEQGSGAAIEQEKAVRVID
jgi:hypothetical protein